jgi:Tubulin-tyrosine ligase family.
MDSRYHTGSENSLEEMEEDSETQSLGLDQDGKLPIFLSLKELTLLKRTPLRNKNIKAIVSSKWMVIPDVIKKYLGWRVCESSKETGNSWDIQWMDHSASLDEIRNLQPYQKINRFPETKHLGRKNLLMKYLKKLKVYLQDDYTFFPETWILPLEYDELKTHYHDKLAVEPNRKPIYIIKPENGSCGEGIFLTDDITTLQSANNCVVQEYLSEPLLIDGLKFDLRIYVLIKSISPLKIFIYREGMARFATQKYVKPSKENLNDIYMHLTNYAVNKTNPEFQFFQEEENQDGHKRSFTWILKYLKDSGQEPESVFKNICDVIIKTIAAFQPHLEHTYKTCQPREENSEICFELLGFDIILDKNYKPWVLEVNRFSSLNTDSKLDKTLKEHLLLDLFTLLNVNGMDKKPMESNKAYIPSKPAKLAREEIIKLREEINEWEEQNSGGFLKIYPPKKEWGMSNYSKVLAISSFMWDGLVGVNNRRVFSKSTLSKPTLTSTKIASTTVNFNKGAKLSTNSSKEGISKFPIGSKKAKSTISQ